MPGPFETANPEVSIVVPARNEEANLGDCLRSLVSQSETGRTGIAFEIVVVDDGSTDRTREIAQSFPGVRVVSAPPLRPGWTGKNNAVVAGAAVARGEWLLFTDADTVHLPGSLERALAEAKRQNADLLSYSPQQIAVTFWEMVVLPVVFSELACAYPPKRVSDPASPVAAANGQYILIRREAYQAVGGHAALAGNLLEDVALARAVKASGRKIYFRYAADAVRTRMYRNFRQLREGWTKNLALLFPRPGRLAFLSLLRWGVPWAWLLYPLFLTFLAASGVSGAPVWFPGPASWRIAWIVLVNLSFAPLYARVRAANFDLVMELLAMAFGYPMFAYLLLRSRKAHSIGSVSWKGRSYGSTGEPHALPTGIDNRELTTDNRALKTENCLHGLSHTQS